MFQISVTGRLRDLLAAVVFKALMYLGVTAAFAFLIAHECLADDSKSAAFREQIAPLLVSRCLTCHGGTKVEGGYSVATPVELFKVGDSEKTPIVGGKLDDSELWRRLITEDKSERMPLDAAPLPDEQLAAVKAWIVSGASIAREDMDRRVAGLSVTKAVCAPEHYPRALAVNALAISDQSDEIWVGGYAEVTRWNIHTGELTGRFDVAGQHVAAVDITRDGKTLAVSSGAPGQRGVIELIAIADPVQNRVALAATADIAPDLAISTDGKWLAIGGHDGSLRVVELENAKNAAPLTPHADAIFAVAWSPDGSRLVTASRDRTAKLFDAPKLELIASYDRHERAVGGAGFAKDRPLSLDETGRLRLMAGDDSDSVVAEKTALPRVLQRFSSVDGEILIPDKYQLRRFRTEKKAVDNGKDDQGKAKQKEVTRFVESDALEISPAEWITAVTSNSMRVAVGTQQGTVTVWDRQTQEVVGSFLAKP